MSEIRPVQDSEVELKVSEELKLVVNTAAQIFSAYRAFTPADCVKEAYSIIDLAEAMRQKRLEEARTKELRRRRGW